MRMLHTALSLAAFATLAAPKDAGTDLSVIESREVTTDGRNETKTVMIAGVAYDVVDEVNLPTLKHETGDVVSFTILDAIRMERSIKEEEATVNGVKQMVEKETVINVVRVRELTSGQKFEYVCNAITADNLRGAYQDHSYVGRSFAIQKLGVVAGKRYKDVKIIEIQPKTEVLA